MAGTTTNSKSILKNDPDFQGLDFGSLRTEGINHIADLSGKVWTDHNVHDPGITILELLIYALIDLGYRTKMPAIDIFSRDPEDTSVDDNFYTPAQILTCNPVTIIDFRKLLIDISEVKNAWLEISEEPVNCQPNNLAVGANIANVAQPVCRDFLNGLYKVYIELYKGPYVPESKWSKAQKDQIEYVVEKVRAVLMAHRNLCEDFVSVTVLCKEKIGVCADIELTPSADPEKVYKDVMETLRKFFSPEPKFYTLQQLLDKGMPIDEIYAGRPYLPESHGFVDTNELEELPFRKVIHISDVYDALFKIDGVQSIRRLRLRKCGSKDDGVSGPCDWDYQLSPNHTAEFSPDCSGFLFTRNGFPISINEKKFKDFFELTSSLSGKVLYTDQLPALDLPIPKGIFRSDLSAYTSIQNELPRVYGIREGGLPATSSILRQAQALQLRGFLLFFDQLFANYLAQLGHLRNLFSLKKNRKPSPTYFTQLPEAVPERDQLLRFGAKDNDQVNSVGSILAIPIERKVIEDFIEQDILKNKDLADFKNIQFVTVANRDEAVYTLAEDFQSRNFSINVIQKSDECWFYYIFTASDEVALVSKSYYPDEKSARVAATNITYLGTFKENYYRFSKTGTSFSFNMEFNMADYAIYLQQIVEDKQLYLERRKAFLDHLLAMFAESFTDFALLSFDLLQEPELQKRDLAKKTSFLSSYDELSRNRGKGYDYKTNGWNKGNVSGFEKKVQAYAGIDDCCGQFLCHFEVMEYTGQYYWSIPFAGKNLFKANTLFDSVDEAVADLEAFLFSLKNKEAYKSGKDSLSLNYNTREVVFGTKLNSEEHAAQLAEQLRQLVLHEPLRDEIYVSNFLYRAQLVNEEGQPIKRTAQLFDTANKAMTSSKTLVKKINEEEWESIIASDEEKPKFDLKSVKSDPFKLVDVSPFTKDVILCPDEFRWMLNDPAGNKLLVSESTYASPQIAMEHMMTELTQDAFDESNFLKVSQEDQFSFQLKTKGGGKIAASLMFPAANDRDAAINFVLDFCNKERSNTQYTYEIKEACHWQVDFGNELVFRSVTLFADKENALNTWRKQKGLFRGLKNFSTDWDQTGKQKLSLVDDRNLPVAVLVVQPEGGFSDELFNAIQQSLTQRSFELQTISVEAGYGFRLQDNLGNNLLSAYEVYAQRGGAFYAMLNAVDKAKEEGQYLKSGDEGNREFTFLLKNDGFEFIAEHPQVYDSDVERNEVLQKAIDFLKNMHRPADTVKEKTSYTYGLRKNDAHLLNASQKFAGMREISENVNLLLLLASDPSNYSFVKSPEKESFELRVMNNDQILATAPGKFDNEYTASEARDRILAQIKPSRYNIISQAYPDKWKFRLALGVDNAFAQFQSTSEFETEELAKETYRKIASDPAGLKINRAENEVLLISKHKLNKANLTASLSHPAPDEAGLDIAEKALGVTQLLHNLSNPPDKRPLQKMVKKDELAEEGTWVYRVRRKEDFIAYHLNCNDEGGDHETLIKNLYSSVTGSRSFMMICLGGDDIILEKQNPATGQTEYHFQIVGRLIQYPPVSSTGDEFVLFVSTEGYASPEEAASAFDEKYLLILKKASKAFNYGEGKYISLVEPTSSSSIACTSDTLAAVYVPASTMHDRYADNNANAVADLVELAKSYPIRLSGKNGFKFSLYDYQKKLSQFISKDYYDSPAAAMMGFFFLLVLIRNRKNYYWYCDPDTGNQFIVLREILLESKHRYATSEDAWNGIEQLIAIAQTEGGFHIYQSLENCCYSFFVACKGKIIHPCTYDTTETQLEAYHKLLRSFSNYQLGPLPEIKLSADGTHYEVWYKGKNLANIPSEQANPPLDPCVPGLFDLIDQLLVLDKCTNLEEDGKFVLKNADDQIVASFDSTNLSQDDWINALLEMVMNFPVYRKDGLYYFRLPYPPAIPDTSTNDPCGCGKELPPDSGDCYLAWIGGCFNTCTDALNELKALLPKLKVEENYRLVFDCVCGAYRIEFIEEDSIVAVNPQCYTSKEMDCEAVDRAKGLINCEGMHLVEHILLRPRCEEHCKCLIPDCPDVDCRFTWETGDDDPCKATESPACFTPGKDPYSFIATIVLPAWSLRFKKQANRDLLTKILQREAPAHVLLRIQYLSPKDVCTFETQFKLWIRWLANKTNYCGETFDLCSFIDILFKRRLDCWWPIEYCETCVPPATSQNPCAELTSQVNRGLASRVSVNDVYCWQTLDCSYEFRRVKLKPEQENEKVKLIRKRTVQYSDQLNQIREKAGEDPNIEYAITFIKNPVADDKGLIQLTKRLDVAAVENKEKILLYRQTIDIVLSFYLDRALLDQFDPGKLDDIRRTMRNMNMKKQDSLLILQKWNVVELKGFIHDKTIEALGGIFNNK